MQITKINSINYVSQSQNNNNPKYNNVHFGQIPPTKLLTNTQKKAYEWFVIDMINYIPSITSEKLAQYINHKNKAQTDFLYHSAKKLHFENYHQKQRVPENAIQMVEELAFNIEKPDRLHYKILENPSFSFADSKNLILLAQESKQNYSLIRKLLKIETISKKQTHLPANQIQEIVTSPNATKLNEQYETFSPYITLTHKNKDFTTDLIKELAQETPSFNSDELRKVIEIERSRSTSQILNNLPTNVMEENYNPKTFSLFTSHKVPRSNYNPNAVELTTKDTDFYTYILKTTNDENFDIRKSFLKDAFGRQDSLDTTTVFLNKLDTDKDFKKIYINLYKDEHTLIKSPEGADILMYYTELFGSDVILKKIKNFKTITMELSHNRKLPIEKTTQELSQNLNNNHYISNNRLNFLRHNEHDLRYSTVAFSKLKANIARAKRKFNYEFLPKILGKGETTPIKTNISFAEFKANLTKQAEEIQKQA